LFAEAAAAFEELTLNNRLDELTAQVSDSAESIMAKKWSDIRKKHSPDVEKRIRRKVAAKGREIKNTDTDIAIARKVMRDNRDALRELAK
jgi:hypothetical protein